jgi:hypothetical protein
MKAWSRLLRVLLAAGCCVPVAAGAAQDSPRRTAELVEVGREHWEKPWLPDLKKPGGRVAIPEAKRCDVVILGDGYTADERAAFEKDVRDWYDRFLKYTPWNQMRGALRVRGLFTPGEGRATPDLKSHYKIPATESGVGNVNSNETRRAIFDAIERTDANPAQSRNQLTHTTVVMLVKNERGRNPSGMTRGVTHPDGRPSVRVAFAADTHHEFGHAYGGLRDEYIESDNERGQPPRAPERISFANVSNIAYTKDLGRLPWAHLSPGSAANPDPDSLIGICWLGGGRETGAWHSEARCLMNGTHDNWDLSKSRRGVNLRDRNRFCFWCEEILVAKTWWRTGLLGESDDLEALWKKWADEVRPLYHKSFDVPGRIKTQNETNARERLADARIYERPS